MLKDILAISGQPGLFKMLSKGSNNVIVESLVNGKRFPAFSSNKIISLEDIAIYTSSGEVSLEKVLKKIAEKEGFKPSIDHKSSPDVLKNYFIEILPDYDQERVYVSDIKKVIHWYNMLLEKDMLVFEEEKTEGEAKEAPEAESEPEG
ncbi:MAG: DUF5606 domain-containing protein [Prolixibacteraceae bacterium]|nr:DUF5606 domain-containing protein [Prolixibacteraceae bacterium]